MLNWLSWENPVAIWWLFLSSASVFNILFWSWTKIYAFKNQPIRNLKNLWIDRNNIIWFSGIYVFVCAFRSFFPKADVQRIALFDTWFSSVFLGRTIATVGELAFIIQWLIVIRFLSEQTKSKIAYNLSFAFFPIICIAEVFSWYSVITTHYLGNSIEESLWAFTYVLICISLIDLQKYLIGALKLAVRFSIAGCLGYIYFMATVDVPMYVSRLIEDNNSGKVYLGFWEGLLDLNTRWIVTHSISDWKSEIPWQTLYFTFAVLVSIALCYAPLSSERIRKYLKT